MGRPALRLRRRIFLNNLATLVIATSGALTGMVAGNIQWRNAHGKVQSTEAELHVIDSLNLRILQATPARGFYQSTERLPQLLEHMEKDRLVLNEFLSQIQRFRLSHGGSGFSPAMETALSNLSAQSLATLEMLQLSRAQLAGSGDDPAIKKLVIESLSHSSAIDGMQACIQELEQLRRSLAIDLEKGRSGEEKAEMLEVLIPVASSLLASAMALLFAWHTSPSILRPIDQLNQRISLLRSSGNLQIPPLEPKDVPLEIRSLNDNFNGLIQRLADVHAQLEQLSLTDPLTQVGNRRCFDRMLLGEVARHRREGASMALLLLDLDRFKSYNDCYGHPAGDQCLIAVADVLKHLFRRSGDCICRIGGEEFAVVLPRTALQEAEELAFRIVKATEALDLEHRANPRSDG